MKRCAILALGLYLLVSGLNSDAQTPDKGPEKVLLVYKALPGKTARYMGLAALEFESGGQKFGVQMRQVEKVTFTSVAANGDLTLDSQTESLEIIVNGRKAPDNPDHDKTTIVSRSDGSLISVKSEKGTPQENQSQARLHTATSVQFSSKPVGVGDKWSVDYPSVADVGLRAAHGDYEVLGFEKVNNVDAVKLKMSYRENGNSPLTVFGTVWMERSSGDGIKDDLDIENLEFGPGSPAPLAKGKLHDERIEGSPLGDAKYIAQAEVKPKDKTIDETVKDFEKLPGLFTLYRKRESGRETVYMEVREDQLDKLMMLEMTASTGTSGRVVAGDPLSNLVFKFTRTGDDRILLATPNIDFRADPNSPISRSLKRSFPDGYLEVFRVEAKQSERKSLLLNVSDLFRGDISELSLVMRPFALDAAKTYVSSWKNFPDNLVVETNYHFAGAGLGPGRGAFGTDQLADTRSIPIKVVYNLFPLPENGFRPRLADPRVGYFVTSYQTFDDDSRKDPSIHYIYRWNLQKADPKAAMSPPKQPIVFWLDNAIPVEYRDAVREGLLLWNKGFEKIGIKDALVVKQMPDNADWDHADMRYNTIRWVSSPSSGYAVAQFRVNPLTGQILNANITVDSNFTRYIKMERRTLIDPASYFNPPAAAHSAVGASTAETMPVKIGDPAKCELGEGMMEQAWFGNMALHMLTPAGVRIDDQAYIRSYLREVVGHEMGHIMGLRHNFIASTYLDETELKNSKDVQENGCSASLMDYCPFNIFALKQKGVDYFSSTIGPYDLWAIQYGYMPIDATSPDGELYNLHQVASKTNMPGLAFESDEIADGYDPAVTRFDLGREPLAFWQKTMDVSRFLMLHLAARVPEKGENYYEFTRSYYQMLNMYTRGAATASRYVGGLHASRSHRGDYGEKPALAPVDGAAQKRALNLLTTYILAENAFTMPPGTFTKLTENPFPSGYAGGSTFPVLDQISSIQTSALRRMFSTDVLGRIVNNEFKTNDPAKSLTLPELFGTLRGAVWSELDSGRNIGVLHRQLQRAYLDTMIAMTITQTGAPEDARTLAWNELRILKSRIAATSRQKNDTYTRLHLEEALMKVNRALEAKQIIGISG